MENFTLNTRGFILIIGTAFLIITTSCTKNSAEDSLYETQATKNFSPIEKPVVDKNDIRIKPDRSEDWDVTVENF